MAFFYGNLQDGPPDLASSGGHIDTTALLRAAVSINQSIKALAHVALAPETSAQAAKGGLLQGVPLAVKDLIDVAGMPTRMGSRAICRTAQRHAAVIGKLLEEGAIIIGKSHTTEFAMSGWGQSPLGRPLNPINGQDRYFSGGSSNGSASSVACGLVPCAIGTDTGGSIRIPSSWCGITGLKGSPGWISTDGVAPLSQSFDTVGPMARTAADAAILYRAMLPRYGRTAFEQALEQAAQQPLPHLRFFDDDSLGMLDESVKSAYIDSRARCEDLGFTTELCSVPCRFEDMADTWAGISSVEGYLNNQAVAENPDSDLDEDVRKALLQGKRLPLHEYFALLNKARLHRQAMESLLTPGCLIVMPTTSTPAIKLDGFDPKRTLGIYTRFVNLIQGCSIALPNGLSPQSLPTSMQFIGAYGQDASIVHAALMWQKHTDWHEKIRAQHQQQMQERLRRQHI
ncbi:MAG: amidase [Castellaniella sp.]|uniref:amidase n=1 Tax=Castellaniella sp. TaxID=1955812 RepID=UPI003C720F5B